LLHFRGFLVKRIIDEKMSAVAVVPVSSDPVENQCESDLISLGCHLTHTPIDRLGVNPIKDIDLFFNFFKIIYKKKPDAVW